MELNELQESKRSKVEEYEALVNLGKEEKRELTEEELSKVESLKEEVRGLEEQITSAEESVREAEENELKDYTKSEIETSIRKLSALDAETELEKAYIELDKAWRNYYDALEAEEKERKREELKGLVAEILGDFNLRNLEAEKSDSEEALRKLEEEKEALELELTSEREAKEALESKIEENNRSTEEQERNLENMEENKTIFESIRSAAEGNGGTIEFARAAIDGDTTAMAEGIPLAVKPIDVIGKKPQWESMGLTIARGAKGTYKLPFDDPKVAAKLAELSPVTGDAVSPDGVLISPNRFSISKTFTVEAIASATDEFIQGIISNMNEGCDRKITAEVYDKIVATTNIVTGADAIDKDAFDALMASPEVDGDGAFISPRANFFDAKGSPIDAGSGIFLAKMSGKPNEGVTYDGVPYFYNSLFEDAADTSYVCYGDMSKVYVADYNMNEVIVDKYTKAASGQIVITVNKLANVALMNPNAFAKTEDLDPV